MVVRRSALKTLYLLRHAKSSRDAPGLADHDRPLAPRGRQAAPRMAAYLRAHGLIPQRVLCSTAARARQTWELIAPELGPSAPTGTFRPDLYEADGDDLIDMIRNLRGDDRVMLIGHNPALADCAARLAGGGDEAALARLARKYPTAALAEIAFDRAARWPDVAPGDGRLIRFVRPRDVG